MASSLLTPRQIPPNYHNKMGSQDWLCTFKTDILKYMHSIVSRGSKYIHRQKLNLKNFQAHLKKFKFSESEIRRINSNKKKFLRIFEENIKELTSTNPKAPAGYNNPKGNSEESGWKEVRSFMHKEVFQREMHEVKLTGG